MSHIDKINSLVTNLAKNLEVQHWREYFSELEIKLKNEYENKNTQKQYELMRTLESLNGGMGSLNDATHSKEVAQLIQELYFYVNHELIHLWASLGNKTNDLNTIKLYKVNDIVKFVSGKPRYINCDGSIKYVPHHKWVNEQIWRIEAIANPDITNMVQYSLVQGSKHTLVRHDALEKVHKGILGAINKLFT